MFLSFSPPIRFIEKPMCICTTDLHTRESVDHFLRRRSATGAARRAPRAYSRFWCLISFGFQMFPASHDGVEP
jgi:hypothetical protein